MFRVLDEYGVVGRGIREGRAAVELFNPREHAEGKHRQTDDHPYGGGGGMLMSFRPLQMAIEAGKESAIKQGHLNPRCLFFSPQGRLLTQNVVRSYSRMESLVLVSGCYEGMDERIISRYADDEISAGDYVLSGGELPIMTFVNALMRLRDGVLGNVASANSDSFSGDGDGGGGLLEAPHYTRPESIDGMRVPAVLLSGNHAEIKRWRRRQSLGRTWLRRPDLLARASLSSDDKKLLREFIEDRTESNA